MSPSDSFMQKDCKRILDKMILDLFEEAKLYQTLSEDEKMIFWALKAAGNRGFYD